MAASVCCRPWARQIQVTFDGATNVTGLSVAPDGVRIALTVGARVGRPASARGDQPRTRRPRIPVCRPRRPSGSAWTPAPRSAPSITRPTALTWYGADNLVVLDAAGTGTRCGRFRSTGSRSSELPVTPAGTISITADGPANVLVAGLADDDLAVSTSLEGPWQPLGNQGQDPAYPG